MKWLLGGLGLMFCALGGVLYLGLHSVPLVPFISEVEANQEDFPVINKSLAKFIKHLGPRTEGNYPITITFDNFSGDDSDSLGYAIVDNANCDIFLNLTEHWTKQKFTLTLFHELGHCFGLEHSDPAQIMEADYDSPERELQSLPLFFKDINQMERQLLVMDSGWAVIDEPVNQVIDWWYPETKDSLKRVKSNHKHPVQFKASTIKKMKYQEK